MVGGTSCRFDLILEGGLVVDGSGGAAFRADVGIAGDRIAAVGDLAESAAAERLDAAGKAIAPGFIDAHTHDDSALLEMPEMAPKVSQGITTVVAGNCGISIAPARLCDNPPPPLDLLGPRHAYRFPTMAAYFKALEIDAPAVNVIMLAGHSSLRVSAMADLDRPAHNCELAAMEALLDEAMEAGAVGLSTGLAYRPAHAAPAAEIHQLAAVVARHGGLYATHMRDEADDVLPSIAEALATGRETRVPVVISHHKIVGRRNHGLSQETLGVLGEAGRRQPLAIDAYPYLASSTVLKVDRVQQSSSVLITWSEAMPEMQGRELAEIAHEFGCGVLEAIGRLQPAGAIYFVLDEHDVQRILAWPDTMIGSDGLPLDEYPHPRLWGSFPRVLGHYARDVGLFSIEEAVRKMTTLPATVFGLADRGRIAEGSFADLVVFDRARVADRATYLEPKAMAEGIDLVMVNGKAVWQSGRRGGSRPGRVLRRQELDRPMRERCEALGWT